TAHSLTSPRSCSSCARKPEDPMDTSTPSLALSTRRPFEEAVGEHAFSIPKLGSVMRELCTALRSALDDERCTAEESLRRAVEILDDIGGTETTAVKPPVRGGLSPWQVRKVTSYIEAHLDRPIRNEELAAIARLNASHF